MKYPASLIRRPANTLARFSYKLFVVSIIALLISLPTPNHVHAAAGDLDLAFGIGGKVTTDFFNIPGSFFYDRASAVAIQSDGKIVAAGFAAGFATNFRDNFAIARYNSNGSLDSSFGIGGKVSTDFFGADDEALAVAIQSNGKIIAVGSARLNNQTPETVFALTRYNSDGSLDPSFGSGGKVTTGFAINEARAAGVAIQVDGKIVVAGSSRNIPTTYDFALARYNIDGSLDSSFGIGGKVTTDFFGNADQASSLALQSDGKIVVTGQSLTISSTPYEIALVRYNTDGDLDPSFGSGGKVTTDIFGQYNLANAIAIQSNNKIVVAGVAVNSESQSQFVLVRYNTDGSLDPSFGSGGKVITEFFGLGGSANDVVLQPDGRIIAAGVAFNRTSFQDFAVARYNTDGSLDPSFGSSSRITTDFFGNNDQASAVAIQSDGKVVVAGVGFDTSSLNESFALARYNGDGGGFDICLQDDSSGNLLQFNSTTGDYQFSNCRKGWSFTGRGTVTVNSCKMRFTAADVNGSISALANTCTNVGTASVQVNSQGRTFTISDRDMRNNSCGCQ